MIPVSKHPTKPQLIYKPNGVGTYTICSLVYDKISLACYENYVATELTEIDAINTVEYLKTSVIN